MIVSLRADIIRMRVILTGSIRSTPRGGHCRHRLLHWSSFWTSGGVCAQAVRISGEPCTEVHCRDFALQTRRTRLAAAGWRLRLRHDPQLGRAGLGVPAPQSRLSGGSRGERIAIQAAGPARDRSADLAVARGGTALLVLGFALLSSIRPWRLPMPLCAGCQRPGPPQLPRPLRMPPLLPTPIWPCRNLRASGTFPQLPLRSCARRRIPKRRRRH